MRAVVQRVTRGSVRVGDELVGQIEQGLVILLGIKTGDAEEDAAWLANKTANLRIFEDDEGKFNRSLLDVGGAALVVSQFTLYGDARRGRRPSFTDAARRSRPSRWWRATPSCCGARAWGAWRRGAFAP
jgi:D-tyrosyl-tRNA(Tyr) deacylase